jgi:anti-anti-sigma factor
MSLTLTVREQREGVWRVYLVGSLDGKTSPILRNELGGLRGEGARIITFDLKELSYLSAAGLEVILATIEALEARGGEVVLTNLRPQVRKVFDTIQSAPTLSIFRSVEELDRYLDQMQRRMPKGPLERGGLFKPASASLLAGLTALPRNGTAAIGDSWPGPRVLLVDGEPGFRATVRRALQQEGYLVDAAALGAEALARLRQGAYDLMITELYLPDMTGLELFTAVHSIVRAAPPAIILTALGDWGTYARALELGVVAFLSKPVGMPELSHQVARALSGPRLLRARGVPARGEAA